MKTTPIKFNGNIYSEDTIYIDNKKMTLSEVSYDLLIDWIINKAEIEFLELLSMYPRKETICFSDEELIKIKKTAEMLKENEKDILIKRQNSFSVNIARWAIKNFRS